MEQKNELIITIHASPTETGHYLWIVEEQVYGSGFPDWRLVAHQFANSPFEAYKAAMFEINKLKDSHINETKIKYCKDCAYAE